MIDHLRADIPDLRDQATALRGQLDSMAAEFADDPEVSPSEYRMMTKVVRAKLAETETQLADAGRVDVLGNLINSDDVSAVWRALTLDRRRAVVDILMTVRLHAVGRGSRTFRPGTVDIEWRTS